MARNSDRSPMGTVGAPVGIGVSAELPCHGRGRHFCMPAMRAPDPVRGMQILGRTLSGECG